MKQKYRRKREVFGPWKIDRKQDILTCRPGLGDFVYNIPLRELRDAEGVLDWIAHLREKQWANPPLLCDFLAIVEAQLRDKPNEKFSRRRDGQEQ